MKIEVLLKKDRSLEGILTVDAGGFPVLTSYRCLGLADRQAAEAVGNLSRDPLKPFGHIPTGEYVATKVEPRPNQTESGIRTYGPGPRFLLTPKSGPCYACKDVRSGLMIHGGHTGFPMPPGRLRPTHGCLRVDDSTITALASIPGSNKFNVSIKEE